MMIRGKKSRFASLDSCSRLRRIIRHAEQHASLPVCSKLARRVIVTGDLVVYTQEYVVHRKSQPVCRIVVCTQGRLVTCHSRNELRAGRRRCAPLRKRRNCRIILRNAIATSSGSDRFLQFLYSLLASPRS